MIIKKITIKNFKSIYNETVFDFEEIKGFWKIDGVVGSGKTTIGEAIIYGLFGDVHGKNNKDLISWGQKKGYVIIDCISKGNELHIVRNIRGDLDITVNGDNIVFTNKNDAQKQLENEYYDISRMTLELLCIISFNNFKSLSNLSTGDSREFLDHVFGFQTLTNLAEQCKQRKKLVNDKIQRCNTEKYAIEQQINKINQLNNIEKIDGNVEELKQKNSSIMLEINELNKKIKLIRDENQAKIIELSSRLNEIKIVGQNLAKEISFIEKGKCPTCGATIDQSGLDDKRKEKELLTEQYRDISYKLSDIQKNQNKEIDIINSDIKSKQNNISLNNSIVVKLIEQAKRVSINKDHVKDLENQMKVIESELSVLLTDCDEWDMLSNLLTTEIRQYILSSFIPSLNASIQLYTEKLKLPYTIEFDNMFKCAIKLFGFSDAISTASLSTGQLKMVDMCIILGVLKVLMSGISFNITFLDELFSNMDFELRNMICDILKNEISENQTVFVISHADDSANYDGIITATTTYSHNNIKSSNYSVKKLK